MLAGRAPQQSASAPWFCSPWTFLQQVLYTWGSARHSISTRRAPSVSARAELTLCGVVGGTLHAAVLRHAAEASHSHAADACANAALGVKEAVEHRELALDGIGAQLENSRLVVGCWLALCETRASESWRRLSVNTTTVLRCARQRAWRRPRSAAALYQSPPRPQPPHRSNRTHTVVTAPRLALARGRDPV